MNIEKDWFRPGADKYFFGEFYREGDNSNEGYLPNHKLSLEERTTREVNGIKELLDLKKDMFILDAPCGYGRHSLQLINDDYENIYGIDLNEKYIEGIKKNVRQDNNFKVCELNAIDFPDNYFDVVINMFYSFGFYEKDEDNMRVLKEIYRVLKPSGKFLMHTDVNIPYIKKHPEYLMSNRILPNNKKLNIYEIYNEETKRIDGYWEILTKSNIEKNYYSMRVYNKKEFLENCKSVGFKNMKYYSDFNKNLQYSEDKPEMIIICSKDNHE